MKIHWTFNRKENKIRRLLSQLLMLSRLQWWITGILFMIVVIWLIFPVVQRRNLIDPKEFVLGQESKKDVYSTVSFDYQEEVDPEEHRKRALLEVTPVFNLDFGILKKVDDEFAIVRQVSKEQQLSSAEKIHKMKTLFYIGPSDQVGNVLIEASDQELKDMQENVKEVLLDVLANGVIPDVEYGGFYEELFKIDYIKPKLEQIRENLYKQNGVEPSNNQVISRLRISLIDNRGGTLTERTVFVEDLIPLSKAKLLLQDRAKNFPEPMSTVVSEMSTDLLRPNVFYDNESTKKRLEKHVSNGSFTRQKIFKGDKILGVGDIVTESHINKLKMMVSIQRRYIILKTLPGVFLLSLFLLFLLVLYLRKFELPIFSDFRKFLAIIIAMLIPLGLAKVFVTYLPKDYILFLVPTALASIVVSVIINEKLSLLITTIIGLFISIMSGLNISNTIGYFLVTFSGGAVASMAVSRMRHRIQMLVPGVYVAIVNLIVILAIGLIDDISPSKFLMSSVMGVLNGTIVALLTPGLLPVFEYLSRTTTDIELLELSDLNQPLLVQLKERASGSYYHSIDVAKLAEAAAEAINVNSLLARVGAYYHDIGKMTKPEYFIENQKGENVHDNLSPTMSSRIIASHVKDGVRIAQEYRLPKVVQDIIQQHHGNTMIGGIRFYQKAMEADKHNSLRIEDFRYPGPKPLTKEAAIVLLADSVESARHVLLRDNPSYSRLIRFVREIIDDKINDSQLDACDITLRDVELIIDAFVKVLSGIYHTRIEYIKDVEPSPTSLQGREVDRGLQSNNWLD